MIEAHYECTDCGSEESHEYKKVSYVSRLSPTYIGKNERPCQKYKDSQCKYRLVSIMSSIYSNDGLQQMPLHDILSFRDDNSYDLELNISN